MLFRNLITLALCICIFSSTFITSIHAQTTTTMQPTLSPTTKDPTALPTTSPTKLPTKLPTNVPSKAPTKPPTKPPTKAPTKTPTKFPTIPPTKVPTISPTKTPTAFPTIPSVSPTPAPTASPTTSPTAAPTTSPTTAPTGSPTTPPTAAPTTAPTFTPTEAPSHSPTAFPTFTSSSCVYERTTWKDWSYLISEGDVSRHIDDEDGSSTFTILASYPQTYAFLFNYQTDMVFTPDSSTWFELEYQCPGGSCIDKSWGIKKASVDLYIYDSNSKYLAVKMYNSYFEISRGSDATTGACSLSRSFNGMTLANDFMDVLDGLTSTWWGYQFGNGFDVYNNRGGLEDGKVWIRVRNDDVTQTIYLNIRVKYISDATAQSYLCAISGSFTPNSQLSFALVGKKGTYYGYRIQHIALKSCSDHWDIPTEWCEAEEAVDQQYSTWNNPAMHEVTPTVFIHGLFHRLHTLRRIFTPVVAHEAITVAFDLYYTVHNRSITAVGSYFRVEVDTQLWSIRAPDNVSICDQDWVVGSDNYCTKRIEFTKMTSESQLDLDISFDNVLVLHNNTVSWGFTNLCINQSHEIAIDPTPSPTDPPTMLLTECSNYKTRLSDWNTIFDPSLTHFVAHGIQFIEFSSLIGLSAHESDWLLSIATNLYFPTTSTLPIWLNVEMHGFRSLTNAIQAVQPIIALSDGTKFAAVHFTKNGLQFYPECGLPLMPKTNASLNINHLFSDPLKNWTFVRSDDYWISQSGYDPPVFDPSDIVLKYLSDPANGRTYLYIDRKVRPFSSYIKNLTWVCSWDDIYTDDNLVYFVAQTKGDPSYLMEDIEFDQCSSYWDIPGQYCDDLLLDITKWSNNATHEVSVSIPFSIHGKYNTLQTIDRAVSPIFYHERVIVTANLFTFGYTPWSATNAYLSIRINSNQTYTTLVCNDTCSVPATCLPGWTHYPDYVAPDSPLCSMPIYFEYIEFSKEPIMIDIRLECPEEPGRVCTGDAPSFTWGFNTFCMDTQHQLTHDPTPAPTADPTTAPTDSPSLAPTIAPTDAPSLSPTAAPSQPPTAAPSSAPSQPPSAAPSQPPTAAPSTAPSQPPTAAPTTSPTAAPSLAPSVAPTLAPSIAPTDAPSLAPTGAPSVAPTLAPSVAPSLAPTIAPTLAPSLAPSRAPSLAPSDSPTAAPSRTPTSPPSIAPTLAPTAAPHSKITLVPTGSPTQGLSVTPAPTVEDIPDGGNVPDITHPPFVFQSYFNAEGTTITVIFDLETNMPTHSSGYGTCHYVLALSDDSILGTNAQCVWRSRTVFVITLEPSTSNIVPDGTLRTKQHVLDRWGVFQQGHQQYFIVSEPDNPIAVVAEISGPKVVGQCARFTLSSASFGAKDSQSIEWSLVSPQPSTMQLTSYGNLWNIDVNSFGAYLGPIQISLTATNWMGHTDTTTHIVTRATIDAPVVSISGKKVQILETSHEFTLISNAYLASCTGTTLWNIGIQWMQITDENQIIADGIDTSTLISPITYTDTLTFDYDSSSSLSIPAFGLQDDTSYLFYVYASNGGDLQNKNTTAFAHVIVTAFDIPTIKTVNQKTIGTNAFTLYYTDFFEFPRGFAPDNNHYLYTWDCIYTKLPENTTLSSADKNYVEEFGYSWSTCGDVTNQGVFPMSDTSPFELNFGAFAFIPNSVYIITLEISDNRRYFRNKRSSVSLFTKPVELPEITITSSIASINPHDHAVITVEVDPKDAIIVWRPTDTESNLLPPNLYALSYIAIKEEINENSNTITSNLVLNPDFDLNTDVSKRCSNDNTASFEGGKEYGFTIWARNHGTPSHIIDYYASTNIIVTINSEPTGGSCSVTPTTGTAVETRFEFSCQDWYDPDGDSEAITYNFMYNDVFLGEDFSSSSYLTSVIGGTNGVMVAYIKDEAGLTTCYDIPFTVTPRFENKTEQVIVDTINNDMESIQAYLLAQSIGNTLQNALAVSEMIRELSRKLEDANFTRTLNQYKNDLMQYVIQSQDNSAQSINSALQHIQAVDAMLNEDPLDSEDSLSVDFGTADEILVWIDGILANYQKTSTSDSDILLPPMLSLLVKLQSKALDDHISVNATDVDVGDAANVTNHILEAAVGITLNTLAYGSQNRVLGEQITHTTPIINGQAMRTRPNPFSFACPTTAFGRQFVDISFPDLFYEGMEHQSSVTCSILRMPRDYYGVNPYISTDIFEIDVLSVGTHGEVEAANPFVSSSFSMRRRNLLQRRRLPVDNDEAIIENGTLDGCHSIIFSMDLSGEASDVFFDDIDPEANKTIFVPICKFYDSVTESWDTEGCITLNYTHDTVWCSCQHLTSFAGVAEAFKPQVNLITSKDLRNLNAQNVFLKYPVSFCTLCVLHFVTLMLLCFLPKPDDTPLLARADVLQNKLRRAQAMERWRYQRFVDVLQSPMNLTKKLLRLFAYKLQDDHSVLSLFARSEGTNYSTTQRVMILHLYLISVMGCSALFYGQVTGSPLGDTALAIYASVLSSIPVWGIRYMFQYSRPKETKEFVEWESRLLAKKLIALKATKKRQSGKALKQRPSKGKLDLTVAQTAPPEPKGETPQEIAETLKVAIDTKADVVPSTKKAAPSPALEAPQKRRTPTVGDSHHIDELSYNFPDDEEISESEQDRLMADIFNLDRPNTHAPKSSVLHQPKFVMEMDNNQNLHHRVQSVIRRHLSMFVNPEMHKSLLNEVQSDNEDDEDMEDMKQEQGSPWPQDTPRSEDEAAASGGVLGAVDLGELFSDDNEDQIGQKYEITIYSAPLGIILESDAHGYNTSATEITKEKHLMYESAGIKVGMVLSHLNDINVLGLPFKIVKKKLMESTYAIKLSFMSEKTVLIRFDWVLSAASFIHHALKKGYDKKNLVKFLGHEGMSKLEVRSAVHLKNEHPRLLPRVKRVTDEAYLRNEMNANTMFTLFMDSEWGIKVSRPSSPQTKPTQLNIKAVYTPPATTTHQTHQPGIATQLFENDEIKQIYASENEDSSVDEAMGDMLDMFGLDGMPRDSAASAQAQPQPQSPPQPLPRQRTKTEEEEAMIEAGGHAQTGTMVINADDINYKSEDEEDAPPPIVKKQSTYGNTLGVGNAQPHSRLQLAGNQSADVPRHSKLMTESDTAHIFLSQLQLIKLNSSDPNVNAIPPNCYTLRQFVKALKHEAGAKFSDNQIEEMTQEMMDVNATIQYGQTLVSDVSFNEFLRVGVPQSAPAKELLKLLLHEEEDDASALAKPSVPSMNAPMMDLPILTPEDIREEEDNNNKMMDELYVTVFADILVKRLKDEKYKDFRQNLPTKKRRKLLKYYYPLPRHSKSIGWILLLLLSLFGGVVILMYGLKFDILFYANVPAQDDIYLQSACPGNLTDISVNELIQYSIDKKAMDEYVQPNINDGGDGSFGEDVTDSRRFVLVIAFSVIQSLLIWQPVIILLFSILIIVNHVAGKSADMSLLDYAIAAVHIVLCQFCRNYRSYTRDLSVKDEEEDGSGGDTGPEDPRESASSKLSIIKEQKEKETENVDDSNAADPDDKQVIHTQMEQSVEFATLKQVASASVTATSTADGDNKRSSLSSQQSRARNEARPQSTRLRGLSGSRSRSASLRAAADLPASYKFVTGFDTMYDENKFESLATQLADDEFDWNAFGMDSADNLVEEEEDQNGVHNNNNEEEAN